MSEAPAPNVPDEMVAKLITELAHRSSQQIAYSMGSRPPNYNAGATADALRKSYLDIFQLQHVNRLTEEWSIENLKKAGRQMCDALTITLEENPIKDEVKDHKDAKDAKEAQPDPFILQSGGSSSPVTLRDIMTVGVLQSCDLHLNAPAGHKDGEPTYASRVHCLLVPLPKYHQIAVVDVGCLYGIVTVSRSDADTKPLEKSSLHDRRALLFGYTEECVLKLGQKQIAINPRSCLMCLNRPPTLQFNCGHTSCCNTCYEAMQLEKQEICPRCKIPVSEAKAKAAAQ